MTPPMTAMPRGPRPSTSAARMVLSPPIASTGTRAAAAISASPLRPISGAVAGLAWGLEGGTRDCVIDDSRIEGFGLGDGVGETPINFPVPSIARAATRSLPADR